MSHIPPHQLFADAVQLFSALYSMLPSAKAYLIAGGFSPQPASYLLIGLFLAGVLGIQILSRAMHRFIPTHVVDCDHTHDVEGGEGQEEMEEHHHQNDTGNANEQPPPSLKFTADGDDEDTPLLLRDTSVSPPKRRQLFSPEDINNEPSHINGYMTAPSSRRPSLVPRSLTRTLTKLTSPKVDCDENGPCKGFSDPCGQDCFKGVTRQATLFSSLRSAPPALEAGEEEESRTRSRAKIDLNGRTFPRSRSTTHHYHHPVNVHIDPVKGDGHRRASDLSSRSDPRTEHHHHVPTNAFLSIGLQTSIAIALHKSPEGFITYATNHANPTLGFAVFMALFIHNITEGFAMALPLYLALQSRTKAVVWSSFLGGVSQPLGAGIAAIWFKWSRKAERGCVWMHVRYHGRGYG